MKLIYHKIVIQDDEQINLRTCVYTEENAQRPYYVAKKGSIF